MNIWLANLVLSITFISACTQVQSKEPPKYVVGTIPDALKKNADAVTWEYRTVYEIISPTRSSEKIFMAIAILTPAGKSHARIVLPYDKHVRLTSIRGSIFDANGAEIKKLKQSEIYDQSASGENLFSDLRLKACDLSNGSYPYTIEVEYSYEYKSLFFSPDFHLYPEEKTSVINAEFSLTYPPALKPRYKLRNFSAKPEITNLNSQAETMTWKFRDMPAIEAEPLGPSLADLSPTIATAPSSFVYDDYSGSMESWNSYGQWIGLLNKGRDVLPESTKSKIKSITAEFKDPEEKIRAVYEYLQSTTRYVSIQLGIGGYQPFEAALVDKVGYGDCKALSNYMVSLLAAAGIKAHYALVYAGQGAPALDHEFPSSQFNHVIVCVPQEKDSVWLECTSQRNPFGYMGTFTGNRKALIITEQGARPAKTPVYSEKDNVLTRTANLVIDPSGNAKAKISTIYRGVEYEDVDHVLGTNTDEQKKWVQQNTNIPVFDINAFSFTDHRGKIPVAKVTLDLTLQRFATVSGKRLFLAPNLMNRSTSIPPQISDRKTPVVLRSSFTHIDTINYAVSEQLYPEHLPEPVKFSSRFGTYESSFTLDAGKVTYIRKFIRTSGTYPADSYKELVEFYKNVNKADNQKIVFLNKT